MPAYSANVIPLSIAPHDVTNVWNAETPAPGVNAAAASAQVALVANPTGSARSITVAGSFSGAPGAFEIDIQAADVDADASYVTIAGGAITAVNANNSFYWEGEIAARFVRLQMPSRANGVSVTATIGG